MTVVVTGAAGFVGRHLSARLSMLGNTVIGIDRAAEMPSWVTPICADLANPTTEAERALRSAEAVWHLAARPGVRDRSKDVERRRFLDNVCATHIVCDLVPDQVPLVFTSSSSVYGGALITPWGLRASRESDQPNPRGGYARSKLRAERVCVRRMGRGGKTCIARPFTVVGEGQRADMALSRWIEATRSNEPITIFGSLQRERDLTDVHSVVESLVALATNGMGRTVNIGTGRAYSLEEMIRTVFEVLGSKTEVRVVPADLAEVEATLADTGLLEALTNSVPTTNLESVVARQVLHTALSERIDELV